MLRFGLLLLLAAALLVPGQAAFGKPEFNVDAFFGWDGCYRPMEWTPVEIGINSNLAEPFAGAVTLSAEQDGLNVLNISHKFVLTPDVPLHVPLVTKLAFAASSCNVRIANQQGRTQWRHDFELWDYSNKKNPLTPVTENDLLIGVVGLQRFGLVTLAEQTACVSNRQSGKVYIKEKLARMVPWDWTGFASLDLLILYDPDWDRLNAHQAGAIVNWVSNGGKLLVILGSHPLTANHRLAQFLPFRIGEAKEIAIGIRALRGLKLKPSEPEPAVCWPLEAKDDSHCYRMESESDGQCLFGTGYAGFGRVGVLAFDPASLSAGHRADSAGFWVNICAKVLQDRQNPARPLRKSNAGKARRSNTGIVGLPGRTAQGLSGPNRNVVLVGDVDTKEDPGYRSYQYEVGRAQLASNAIMEYLYDIAEMRPLSIWWVILLLALLAALLGPVDYIILKRRGRLPLTWLTCTGWIVMFSVGAYYGVQHLRSGKMQFRAVSVHDGIQDSDFAWSTTYSGLFAPSSDDYDLTGLGEGQWWSAAAPVETHLYGYRQQSGTRNIYCYQHDGANTPYSVPVNIWTMQCLLTESAAEKVPIEAVVRRSGNEASVEIVNRSGYPIKNGYVFFKGDRSLEFAAVGPGEREEFSGALASGRKWDGNIKDVYMVSRNTTGYQSRFDNDTAFSAQGCMQRTEIIKNYLAHGAAVVCVEFDDAPTSFGVKDRPCDYSHIQLVRLVVFPEQKEEL